MVIQNRKICHQHLKRVIVVLCLQQLSSTSMSSQNKNSSKIFSNWVLSRLFESDLKNELELNFWTAVLTTRKSHNELNLLHVTDVIIIVFDTFVSIYRILNFININFRLLDYQSLHRKLKREKESIWKIKQGNLILKKSTTGYSLNPLKIDHITFKHTFFDPYFAWIFYGSEFC